MPAASPLLITADDELLHDVLRLAAAAGVTMEVHADARTAARSWSGAAAVLVGDDQASSACRLDLPRRGRVHVVGRSGVPDRLFRSAVDLGAASVLELPSADRWLVSMLTDIGDDSVESALTVGVLGGSGGVGATTLAAALAVMAGRRGRTVLVDLDPRGPGLATVCGFDEVGIGWDELGQSQGRLSARALREALARRGQVGVLGWRAGGGVVPEALVRETFSAARRGHDWVVVDLPRVEDGRLGWTELCDRVVLVVAAHLCGVASAARLVHAWEADGRFATVVRTARGGPSAEQVARAVGLPLLAELRPSRRLEEQLALGLGPVHSPRAPLTRTAVEVLDLLDRERRQPAS